MPDDFDAAISLSCPLSARSGAFITEACATPKTGDPFELLPAEIEFFQHCWHTGENGRLLFPELLYSAPKKSGKTAFGAIFALVTTLVYGGRYAETYCVSNDYDQAVGRVFQAIRRIVETSPLRAEARILSDKIEFSNNATIEAIASDYASAAGANPSCVVLDELWGFVSERSHRLFDELVPAPTRKISCRLTVTHAGFEGESLLLQSLYERGLKLPLIGTDLYAGDQLLMFWSHVPVAFWQDEAWIEQMRRALRPNQFLRMVENRFVSNETNFVDMAEWDRCVDPEAKPILEAKSLPVWVAIDASVKHDASVVLACSYDYERKATRLVNHKVFQPSPDQPLNFEATIAMTVKDWCNRYNVRAVYYDPYQMVALAQRLQAVGLPMAEFAQTVPNLAAIGSNLYALIRSNSLIVYPDADLRLAISRAVSKETERGVLITKAKASHKIDLVVALAMAAKATVEQGPYTVPMTDFNFDYIGVHSAPRQYFGDIERSGDKRPRLRGCIRARRQKPGSWQPRHEQRLLGATQ